VFNSTARQIYTHEREAVESSWNVMAHGNAREGKWRGNWRMEWVASTLHTTSEHGVSNITTADAHISAASSRLNWRPRWYKRSRPFRRKTKSGFCACAVTFQTQSNHCVGGWVGSKTSLDGCGNYRSLKGIRTATSLYTDYILSSTYLLSYLLTYLLTYSMEQSPSWEANWFCS